MDTEEQEQRVPRVPEALYGLGARGIRGLPLAGALSRRHVCFSVVKRAAGRQTGLNQPLPPPPPPPTPPTGHHLLFPLRLAFSIHRTRVLALFLFSSCFRPSIDRSLSLPLLFSLSLSISFLSLSACSSRAGRARLDQESVRWVTNCFLFERTN